MNEAQRCGYIGLVGRPNVGKSTLLNRILGQELSITAAKPQTTRHRILGIRTRGNVQMVFADTPGLHDVRRNALNRVLNRTALAVVEEVDCVVLVVQMPRIIDADRKLLSRLQKNGHTLVIALNKIDRVAKTELLPVLQELSTLAPDVQIVPPFARLSRHGVRISVDPLKPTSE